MPRHLAQRSLLRNPLHRIWKPLNTPAMRLPPLMSSIRSVIWRATATLQRKAKELVGDRQLTMGIGRFLTRMGAGHPWWGKYEVSRGQMVEQTTHVFDLIRYFLGDVANVHAYGIKGVSEGIADFEECTVCNMQFESGAVGSITSTCVARAHDHFAAELVGDDFYLKLTLDLGLRGKSAVRKSITPVRKRVTFRQVEQFIKAVEANDQGLVIAPYADAVKSLAVTLAANRSLETGQVEQVAE